MRDLDARQRVPTNVKTFDNLPIFNDFDAIAGLLDDRARIATNERIAPEMLAAFDRFEQKRFARAADFSVGRKRRFDVGQQAACDGNHIALRGKRQKFIKRR